MEKTIPPCKNLFQVNNVYMQEFKDKIVLVTGAASGIGEATSRLFAEQGAIVVLTDVNEATGNVLAENLRAHHPDISFMELDVSNPDDCNKVITSIIKRFGKLDIAFNNAGISGENHELDQMSIEGWNKVINVNLNSVFYCMKYELAQMAKQGFGAIVNMASILGKVGFANAGAYVAAKHGVVGLTETAAIEYSGRGIRINTVGPGFIDTPLLTEGGIDDAQKKSLAGLHPVGRLGRSEEVAELVVWLASDKASFVTGAYIPVDGGYLSL